MRRFKLEDKTNDPMRRMVQRNYLKFAVGHQICCGYCNGVLDCRRAVDITLYKGEEEAYHRVFCQACAKRLSWYKTGRLMRANGLTAEVVRGWILWSRKRRDARAETSAMLEGIQARMRDV